MERLLNVIMTIGSRRRIDRAKLFAVIPEYKEAVSDQAAERMFERDKAAILELGLPLVTESDVLDDNTVYYRIASPREDAVLDLSTAEYTVLLAASRAWDQAAAGGAARRVRAKLLSLGHDADPDLLRRTPRGAVESLPVLSPLLEAVTDGTRVRFSYRAATGSVAERTVEPWVVGVHDGHWYVYGWDTGREDVRMFRASRIESFPRAAGEAARPRPEQVDLEEVLSRMHTGDDRDRAVLRAEPFKALALRDRAGADLAAPELTLPELPRAAARRLLLGEIRWTEVTAPPEWRQEIHEVLAQIAAAHEGPADLAPLEAAPERTASRIRVSSSSNDDVSRLIAVASYVMQRGEVELVELAEALGVTEKQVTADLQVLFLCGDLGTGWEDLIEAEWEHGVVRVRNAEPLRRALRLSAVEVTALLAGLAALAATAGEAAEAIASARATLLAAAGLDRPAVAAPTGFGAPPEGADAPGAGGTSTEPPSHDEPREHPEERTAHRADAVLAAVQSALRAADDDPASRLMIRYSASDRPGTSVRRIRPLRLETDGARSYLLAECELAGAERRFRLDRIVELPAPGTEQHPALPGEDTADLQGVVGSDPEGELEGTWLRLEPPARWIAESFEATALRDGEGAVVYARLDEPLRAPLVDAVLETAGAATVLSPPSLRDTIVTVARTAMAHHS
ncbi:WYL domain-containing protein [Brachybacterium horti]